MITVRTSPAYVNRVRQDWTANGGVYGDGGVYAVVPSNDPFAQLGPTLDLTFAGVPTDQFTAATTDGYSINLNLSSEIYQITAQYAVWVDGSGMTQRNFADIVTFTRASTATYFDATGTLTTAAINAARFDYNPSTLALLGFLIEEQRTNSIRNNTMQGAVAGTPGTFPTNWTFSTTGAPTTQVVGTGTENGITYIDIRFQGTGAADTWNIIYDTSVVAANGQSWTSAVYLKLAAGSAANLPLVQRLVFRNSSFVNIQALDSSAITPTGAGLATQRSTLSLTATQATTAFVTNQLNSGTPTGAYDITLRIGLPQLEQGAFATSVIPTTTTALTRSADVASVNTLSPWFNATESTIYLEFTPVGMKSIAGQGILRIDDNTESNRISFAATSTNAMINTTFVSNSTSGNNTTPATIYAANTTYKIAFAVRLDDVQSFSGGSAGTIDTTALIPSGLSVLRFAANTTDVTGNAWFRRLTYYPRRLSQADGITITA